MYIKNIITKQKIDKNNIIINILTALDFDNENIISSRRANMGDFGFRRVKKKNLLHMFSDYYHD